LHNANSRFAARIGNILEIFRPNKDFSPLDKIEGGGGVEENAKSFFKKTEFLQPWRGLEKAFFLAVKECKFFTNKYVA
jgi:hypothetical protein